MAKPDYSAFLTPAQLAIEEEAWRTAAHEPEQAFLVRQVSEEHGLRSIVEVGCATGWVPFRLGDGDYQYLGIDANDDCLRVAREKNPSRLFLKGDVRTVIAPYADLVVAFSLLKHFHLSEWDSVLFRMLHYGRFGLFSATVAPRSYEDDCEFPHVWVSRERLERAVRAAGHEIIGTPWGNELDTEWMVLTRRCQ